MSSKNIDVLHVSSLHSPRDNRIHYKECLSILNEGYHIAALIKSDQNQVIDGIEQIALRPYNGRLSRFLLGNIEVFRKCLKIKPRLMHFHDPELIPSALLIRLTGIKVIYDLHEDLPRQLLAKKWIPFFLRHPISWLVSLVEGLSVFFFNGIIGATEDISKRFHSSKAITLRNLPLLSYRKAKDANSSGAIRLIYAGGLTELRGIKECIMAMSLLKEEAELILIGSWESEAYKQECMASAGFEKCKYLGHLTMEEVYQEIANADIGLAMLYPLKNYLRSLPVKAFEYMLHAKPILMSDFPSWKETFSEYALFAPAQDSKSMARALDKLIQDETLRMQLSSASLKATNETLNWETESTKLLNLYKSILE